MATLKMSEKRGHAMLRQIDPVSAIKAGIFGTTVLTIIMYGFPPLMGQPPMDIMSALGSIFPPKISPYIPGFLLHFAIGIGLTFIYAALFFWWLPGPHWLRGAIFSILPWLFAIILLGPSLELASRIFGNTSAAAANPCAASNPCAPKSKNPCASLNPCAAKPAVNPCAPANPCPQKPANPCAANGSAAYPCAATANPCAPGAASQAGICPQVLSLMVHLVFGGIVGASYQPQAYFISQTKA